MTSSEMVPVSGNRGLLSSVFADSSRRSIWKILLVLAAYASAAAAFGAAVIAILNKRALRDPNAKPADHTADDEIEIGVLDLRRKAQIARARPTDHGMDMCMMPMQDFDLDRTIFSTLEGVLQRFWIRYKLSRAPYWSDRAAREIELAFRPVPGPAPHDLALLEFMHADCNFSTEHADGSFMDHLQFCYEYSAIHFTAHSPRVLFLHSIMGVGTNLFPMPVDKIPVLQALVSNDEFAHIEAFPSVLRLLTHRVLLDQLVSFDEVQLASIESLSFRRVIDNAEIIMSAEQLWIQLNYQLVHLLDFLPAANWLDEIDDSFFQVFRDLHPLLERAGQLQAHVDFDLSSAMSGTGAAPVTLGSLVARYMPTPVLRKLSTKAMERFSKKIGHSLDYTLRFKP